LSPKQSTSREGVVSGGWHVVRRHRASPPATRKEKKALCFSHNPQFTGDAVACIVVSDTILVMLLMHARFRDFTPKAIELKVAK
jgi:hypothetical protein